MEYIELTLDVKPYFSSLTPTQAHRDETASRSCSFKPAKLPNLGGFEREDASLLMVHGSISKSLAPSFIERLQRVAQDFAQAHQSDQKRAPQHRESYTLLAMRSWDFEGFRR
jgi:hypothetical protein